MVCLFGRVREEEVGWGRERYLPSDSLCRWPQCPGQDHMEIKRFSWDFHTGDRVPCTWAVLCSFSGHWEGAESQLEQPGRTQSIPHKVKALLCHQASPRLPVWFQPAADAHPKRQQTVMCSPGSQPDRVGHPDGVPSSWLWPGPALVVVPFGEWSSSRWGLSLGLPRKLKPVTLKGASQCLHTLQLI